MDPTQWSNDFGYSQQAVDFPFSQNNEAEDADILGAFHSDFVCQASPLDISQYIALNRPEHVDTYIPGSRLQGPAAAKAPRYIPRTRGAQTEPVALSVPLSRDESSSSCCTSDSAYASLNITSRPCSSVCQTSPVWGVPALTRSPSEAGRPLGGHVVSPFRTSQVSRRHSQVSADTSGRSRRRVNVDPCHLCNKQLKNASEAAKHLATHEKPYLCEIPGCSRGHIGFGTWNDLSRHRTSVHKLPPLTGNPNGWICQACPPPQPGGKQRFWPRKDNFKSHIKRKHPDWDTDHLVKISECARPDAFEMAITESGHGSQVDRTEQSFERGMPTDFGAFAQPMQDGDYNVYDLEQIDQNDALVGVGGGTRMLIDAMIPGSTSLVVQEPEHLAGASFAVPCQSEWPVVGVTASQTILSVPTRQISNGNTSTSSSSHAQASEISHGDPPSNSQYSSSPRDPNGGFKCPTCGKPKRRECDLRKHVKRHTRPYGCTFLRCDKRFGSRNDWKRHESSQHFLDAVWYCQFPVEGSEEPCGTCAYDQSIFQQHLRQDHSHFVGPDAKAYDDCARQMELPARAMNTFWCGFCRVPVPTAGILGTASAATDSHSGMEARFKHIGDHYDGKHRKVEHWYFIETRKTTGQIIKAQKQACKAGQQSWKAECEDFSDLGESGIDFPMDYGGLANSYAAPQNIRGGAIEEDAEDADAEHEIDDMMCI